ncbi:MAG: hypothetical protein AAFR26_16205 [Cyanobacteria bacterium J06626_4]
MLAGSGLIEQVLVEANPWINMPARIKVPLKQMPKPFTEAEIKSTVEAFKADLYHHHDVNCSRDGQIYKTALLVLGMNCIANQKPDTR